MKKKTTCHCGSANLFVNKMSNYKLHYPQSCIKMPDNAVCTPQKRRQTVVSGMTRGGFTLAEVLITLGIIGVAAALTMPSLVAKYNERVTVVKVKKAYSVISDAVRLWQAEEGCESDVADCIGQYAGYDCKSAFGGIEKYLNIADRVYQSQSKDVAWLPAVSYGLDGSAVGTGWEGVSRMGDAGTCQYLLSDGTTLSVHLPDSNRVSGYMFIDTNGPKPPNRVSKDIFPIGIGSRGNPIKTVNPYYTQDDAGNDYSYGMCIYHLGNECSADDGRSPTAYVLAHDKLPDLVQMGYPK